MRASCFENPSSNSHPCVESTRTVGPTRDMKAHLHRTAALVDPAENLSETRLPPQPPAPAQPECIFPSLPRPPGHMDPPPEWSPPVPKAASAEAAGVGEGGAPEAARTRDGVVLRWRSSALSWRPVCIALWRREWACSRTAGGRIGRRGLRDAPGGCQRGTHTPAGRCSRTIRRRTLQRGSARTPRACGFGPRLGPRSSSRTRSAQRAIAARACRARRSCTAWPPGSPPPPPRPPKPDTAAARLRPRTDLPPPQQCLPPLLRCKRTPAVIRAGIRRRCDRRCC
mmetsp:Transcript_32824/g.61744  ORF Transcript_32824/g.61744 Transcript_32824/m.61744 type:complete len:283 (-) Transcript_32824:196-1044(-)